MRACLDPTWGPRAKPGHYQHCWRVCSPRAAREEGSMGSSSEVLRTGGGSRPGLRTGQSGTLRKGPGRIAARWGGAQGRPSLQAAPRPSEFLSLLSFNVFQFLLPIHKTLDSKAPHPHLQGEAPTDVHCRPSARGAFQTLPRVRAQGTCVLARPLLASPLPPLGSGHFREASGSSWDPGRTPSWPDTPPSVPSAVGLAP